MRETKASNVRCSLYCELENTGTQTGRDLLLEAGVSETDSLLESIALDSGLPEHHCAKAGRLPGGDTAMRRTEPHLPRTVKFSMESQTVQKR